MTQPYSDDARIPLAEERLNIDKRVVETGRVRVKTFVDNELTTFEEYLHYQKVVVSRVKMNEDVDAPPPVRHEGDLLIVPVVEEYLHVEKRLRVVEELHLRLEEGVDRISDTVPLRRMRAVVEREELNGDVQPQGDDLDENDHRPLR